MVVIEKRNTKHFENRKRRYKRMIASLVVGLLITALIVTAFIIYKLNNIYYRDFIIKESSEKNDSTHADYEIYNKGFLRYSKDGAMAIDFQGNSIWNTTYEMNKPDVDISGEYVIISDKGNRSLELINGSGHVNSIQVLHPIIKAEVASQGVIAVLMDGGDVNYIQLFSATGKELVDARTSVEKNGFPVDFSYSKDGKKLVTSYISINNGLIQSKVTFYNFGAVGQNYEAKVVGGFDYGQTLISKVEFINNDSVCLFGDDKFSIYSMKETPKLIYEKSFESEVKSVAYNENYIGVISKKLDGNGQYQLRIYNDKGKEILVKDISYNYNYFKIVKDEIILYSETELNILRTNGNEKLNITFEQHISYVFPLALKDEYLLVNNSKTNKIKLIK